MNGDFLDTTNHWQLPGPRTFVEFLTALADWLPEDAIVCFENDSPDDDLKAFLDVHAVTERLHIESGTFSRTSRIWHIPASPGLLEELAALMDHHAEPELATHVHAYHGDEILLQWHDAFADPILLSGTLSGDQVRALAAAWGVSYKKHAGRTR
ncbi:MAG: hypothetical protein IT368_09465 [Candidatus Hydrogenedentes bacterium]|nr:hypothetical protein [Candidatus Hydrogenedentota bacterium]